MRKLPEWIGKSDDTQVPPRVKIRIFERFKGLCAHCGCVICGGRLPAYDHIIALANGGTNRESNIQLICSPCHLVKTKLDVAEKSQVYYKRLKHIGIKLKRRKMGYRKFNGQVVKPKWE